MKSKFSNIQKMKLKKLQWWLSKRVVETIYNARAERIK